jgi:hypothetical protein
VKRLRPEHRKIDPADPLSWESGDAARCDLWFPPRKIPLEDGTAGSLPVLVITATCSRFMVARMIPTRRTEDLLFRYAASLRAVAEAEISGVGCRLGRVVPSDSGDGHVLGQLEPAGGLPVAGESTEAGDRPE